MLSEQSGWGHVSEGPKSKATPRLSLRAISLQSLEYLIFFFFFTISAAPFMRTCSSHPQKPFSNSTEKTDKKEKHSLKGSQKESIRFNYRPVLL